MSTVLGTKVESSFAERVEKYCQEMGMTPSFLIRSLLEEEMEQKDKISHTFETIKEEHKEEHKPFEDTSSALQRSLQDQGLTLEKKILALAVLITGGIQETILTRSVLLALARVVNLAHFRGRLNSEQAIADFALLDRAIKNTEIDLDAAEKLSESFKKVLGAKEEKK